MFEHRKKKVISHKEFLLRLAWFFFISCLIILGSLLFVTMGYHWLGDLPWIDALLNASMILSGMGPANELFTESGKLFATFYALYSGIVFLVTTVLLLGPVLHRLLHKFHVEVEEEG